MRNKQDLNKKLGLKKLAKSKQNVFVKSKANTIRKAGQCCYYEQPGQNESENQNLSKENNQINTMTEDYISKQQQSLSLDDVNNIDSKKKDVIKMSKNKRATDNKNFEKNNQLPTKSAIFKDPQIDGINLNENYFEYFSEQEKITIKKELNLISILLNLYAHIGANNEYMFKLLWKRHMFIKELDYLKETNRNLFKSSLYDDVSDVYNIKNDINYFERLNRIEGNYSMTVDAIAGKTTKFILFGVNKIKLILRDEPLRTFLRRANKNLLNNIDNLIKISSYMNCHNNKLMSRFFEKANITDSNSLSDFYKNQYKTQNIYNLPIVSVSLYEKIDNSVEIIIDNLVFNNNISFKSDKTSSEYVNLVNKVTGRIFVNDFNDILNLLGQVNSKNNLVSSFFNTEDMVIQKSETRSEINTSDEISMESTQGSLNIYKCIQEVIDETTFILDLLDQLNFDICLNDLLKIFDINIKDNNLLNYEVENQCIYNPKTQWYVLKKHIEIIKGIIDVTPIESNFSNDTDIRSETDFKFVGNKIIGKSIFEYLSQNLITKSKAYFLFYKGLHLNENKPLFDKLKIINEIFGKDDFQNLLINRKFFTNKTTADFNVYVEGCILNGNKAFLKKLYFFKPSDIYFNNILTNDTNEILTKLIDDSNGEIPKGIFNLANADIHKELSNIYNENKSYYNNLSLYIFNDIDYNKTNKTLNENKEKLYLVYMVSLLCFLTLLNVFFGVGYCVYRCFNKKSTNDFKLNNTCCESNTKPMGDIEVNKSENPQEF